MNSTNTIINLPEKLKGILERDGALSVSVRNIVKPFAALLETTDMVFFNEFTDHGIKHIESTLASAEKLISEETFEHLKPEEVGVMVLSVVLHDIGMYTNAEMFKNMIEGKYDEYADLFPEGKTWKTLWEAFLYDSQYWSGEKKNNVFGRTDYEIKKPDLTDLKKLNEYDKNLIGEFIRIHHCRIAHEVALKGYMGSKTYAFECDDIKPLYFNIAGVVARSHGMDVRDTFDHLRKISGRIDNPLGIRAVYLMVLLRLADYLQIDSSRTNQYLLNFNTLKSPYSRQEHKNHLSVESVEFTNIDKEKIDIQAYPEDALTYVKIKNLAEDIQKELDRSWAILGEVYPDYNYKLRYRRITTNISDKNYKDNLKYVPQRFGFRYNSDLFKLLIAPLYGDDPSFGVRELVQNAVDACRLCLKDLPKNGKPHVKVEVDSRKKRFTITDLGKGMNLYEIENYFLTIGSSYNENIDWQKARDKNHLFRTGRFGIGVLAAFLLGPEITVVTRKRGEKEGGYRFTASMNDNFFQIDKEPNAKYGTKIEIQCYGTCIEKLKVYSEWYRWYIDKNPKVAYFFDGQLKDSSFDSSGYRELKHSSTKYGTIYWKPTNTGFRQYDIGRHNSLYCNGFRINEIAKKDSFSLHGFNRFRLIRFPSLQITDCYNQLPLNLQRTNVEESVKYDFEKELAKEVFVDLLCQLMALKFDSFRKQGEIRSFNYHSNGFSLQSTYLLSCVKEKMVVQLCADFINISDFRSKLKKLDEKSDYFIQLRDDKFNLPINPMFILEKIERQSVVFDRSGDKGYAVIFDDNQQMKDFIQRHNNVHIYNGWLIVTPINSGMEKVLEKTIDCFGGMSITSIVYKEITKSVATKTYIDDLFEKYMHKDPVVPYEYEERKKKFPLLFQDYSEVIEQYRNKKD